MLINIDRYELSTKQWLPHGDLDLETAYAIYSTQHNMEHIENQLNEYGVYRTTTTYERWEWDEELDEDFLVITSYPIRFTPHKKANKKEAA